MKNKCPKFISGSHLKLLAMLTMFIDHVAYHVLSVYPQMTASLFELGAKQISFYYILRSIGRISFPLYCFLLVEGFVHTRSRKRYGINLLLFALVSELPWNFIHSGSLLYGSQNVFFTLFFGYVGLCILEYYKGENARKSLALILLIVFAYFFKADYGMLGVAVIIAMYILRERAPERAVICTCLFSAHFRAGVAFIPIAFYNGERGFIKGKIGKYICYAFYPAHMIVLAVLKFYILK